MTASPAPAMSKHYECRCACHSGAGCPMWHQIWDLWDDAKRENRQMRELLDARLRGKRTRLIWVRLEGHGEVYEIKDTYPTDD